MQTTAIAGAQNQLVLLILKMLCVVGTRAEFKAHFMPLCMSECD